MADYFGRPWPSGVCEGEGARRVPAPLGRRCWYCKTRIWPGHQGSFIHGQGKDWRRRPQPAQLPVHKECSLRSAVGGIYHLRGECQRVGQCEALREAAGLSLREDAVLAWKFFHQYGMSRSSSH